MRALRVFRRARRGSAAVEVALGAPVMLLLLGNLADYGLMLRRHAQLASGVANAAQYAAMTGASVSASTLQSVANASSWLPGAASTAVAASCYCPSGTPAALGPTVSCETPCGGGTSPQRYVTVSATYVHTPIMPGPTGLTATTLSSSATVMVR
jgi:Flp pilus assembly protein TadG